MSDELGQPGEDRAVCTPCGGRGKVISNLGGESHELTCPWCEGTGKFIPGRDAQDVQAQKPGK